MPTQLTVRLPDDLSAALQAASVRWRRKRSEIVRLALERYLQPGASNTAEKSLQELLGSIESGVADLAERQREYVLESLRRGR